MIISLLVFFFCIHPSYPENKKDQHEKIVVIGSLIPTEFSKISRKVTIISRDDLEKAPVSSVAELLKYVAGLDLQTRTPFGVQGDISIRGASFSQVLILINGVKVYDPQTAHHNLDIPVSLANIERIEILHGQGSAIYGENAFGGVINIITRSSAGRTVSGEFAAGSYGTYSGNLSVSLPHKGSNTLLSLDLNRSDGFEYDRDFNLANFAVDSTIKRGRGNFRLFGGYNRKIFGANQFYAPYPSKEWTNTSFFNLNYRTKNTAIKLHYRRHNDKFMLDITRPDWFINNHRTHCYGIEGHSRFNLSKSSMIVIGGELGEHRIESSNIGHHDQQKGAFFSEFETILSRKIYIRSGIRADYYTGYGFEINPHISASFFLSSRSKIIFSLGKAFRIPSFLELYYDSPANKGNPDLEPERNVSFEVGFESFLRHSFRWEGTLFIRSDKNLIDWIRPENGLCWRAENIHRVGFAGLETNLDYNNIFSIGYSYIHSNYSPPVDVISKYVLNHPVHQIVSSLHLVAPLRIRAGLFMVYKKRKKGKGYLVIDMKLQRAWKNLEAYLKVTNLFDTSYQEFPGVAMPGIWVMAGIKIGLGPDF